MEKINLTYRETQKVSDHPNHKRFTPAYPNGYQCPLIAWLWIHAVGNHTSFHCLNRNHKEQQFNKPSINFSLVISPSSNLYKGPHIKLQITLVNIVKKRE